jgi:hypothetical protein
LFTCFDILYWNPSRTVLANGAVRDVVYPTSWFSTTPFYACKIVLKFITMSSSRNCSKNDQSVCNEIPVKIITDPKISHDMWQHWRVLI